MKTFQTALLAALISTSSVVTAHAYTDEDSYVAVSNTAMSVTGDIQFDDFSITFENGKTLSFSGLVSDTFVVDGEEFLHLSIKSVARATRYSKTATAYADPAQSPTSPIGMMAAALS
jgi:hypothetical protein